MTDSAVMNVLQCIIKKQKQNKNKNKKANNKTSKKMKLTNG